ncbi:restriction endonuclease subunit S, partial [Allobaculum stercoricanis]|uniref:restriction endonuclease subunit S n=1 Tax=Allobaculum stercoricanis TaxID=174709 RepID=UPI00294361B9
QELQKYDDLIKARFVEMFGDPLLNDRGWPCKRIGDLFEVISRGKQPTYVEHSTVRVINQACVYWDRINMDNAKYHDNQSSKKMLPISEYSILINSTGTGTLGRCNVFPELRDDYVYVVDSHVTTLQESSEINAWFFKWFFQHNGIQAKIYSECVNGSTNQIELSREKLSNAMMIVPPIELQNQFAEFVIETNKLKVAIQAALDKTQLLFDSLMQEYFG